MRAYSADQAGPPAKKGKGCGGVGGRTTDSDLLPSDGGLLVTAGNFIDGIGEVDGGKTDE